MSRQKKKKKATRKTVQIQRYRTNYKISTETNRKQKNQ